MPTTLFTIEIYYTLDGSDFRYMLRNMTADYLKQFREVVVAGGVMIPVEGEAIQHWKIILPHQIKSIDVWRQEKMFKKASEKNG